MEHLFCNYPIRDSINGHFLYYPHVSHNTGSGAMIKLLGELVDWAMIYIIRFWEISLFPDTVTWCIGILRKQKLNLNFAYFTYLYKFFLFTFIEYINKNTYCHRPHTLPKLTANAYSADLICTAYDHLKEAITITKLIKTMSYR